MIRLGTIDEAHEVFLKVPELDQYLSLQDMKARLERSHLIVVAEGEEGLVGLKIGYPESPVEFYSWLGGVVPNHRHSGLLKGC